MKKSLLFAVFVVLLVSSCVGGSGNQNIPPTSTVQPSPTPPQQLPDSSGSNNGLDPVAPKKKVSVLFLIDRSNSVETDCAFANTRYDVPNFIISLFKKMAKDDSNLLRFGIKFFGAGDDKLYLPITPVSDIYLNSIDFKSKTEGTHDEENNFIYELDHAVELFNAGEKNDDEKIIVLISDGYLNYQHGPDGKIEVQNKIIEIQSDSSVKLALFHLSCSSPYGGNKEKEALDKSIWNFISTDYHYSNDKSLSSITLVSGIRKLIDSTFLINYLPSSEDAGWVLDSNSEANVTVPGDMYAFKSTIVALGANNISFFDATGKKTLDDNGGLLRKNDILYDFEFDNTSATNPLYPVSGCIDYSVKIKFKWQNQEDGVPFLVVGYYVVEPVEMAHSGEGSKLQIQGLEVNGGKTILWNNEPFSAKIDNKIIVNEVNGDIGLLPEYARCYQVWISIPNQENSSKSQMDIKKIQLDKFHIDSVDKSEFDMQNVSLPVNKPIDLTVQADIVKFPYSTNGSEISVASFSSNIQLRFYPILVENGANYDTKDDRYLITLDFVTPEYYDGGHLNIYALNKSNDGVVSDDCSKPEENFSVDTPDGKIYYARLVDNDFYTSNLEDENFGRIKFDIPITGFLKNGCGYDHLLLQWVDSADGVEHRRTVLCSMEQILASCDSTEYQVVGH